MTTARDVMRDIAECASVNDSLGQAARMMRDLEVGALPICGDEHRLLGVVTDRDIVVGAVANELDVSMARVREYAGGEFVTIVADADVVEVLWAMARAGVSRLPVVEGHTLVGMINRADLAKHLPDDQGGRLLEVVLTAPVAGRGERAVPERDPADERRQGAASRT